MSEQRLVPARPLPMPLVWAASLVIALHFFAVLMLVLAARSGPWPTHFGESMAEGPLFASKVNNVTLPGYLNPLRMPHDYHFRSNRLNLPEVYFEARLKDDRGNVSTLKFPAETDNAWLRHRHALLAQALGDDLPVQVPRGEFIAAPGQKPPEVTVWDGTPGQGTMTLRKMPLHLAPKDRPVFQPSEWALLVARSYARHLCQEYGAASVELIRHSKDPVVPAMMYLPSEQLPPDTFTELVCSFGEFRREE
jgi:hypothetical protein